MSRTRLKLISAEPNPEGDWRVILSTSWWRRKSTFWAPAVSLQRTELPHDPALPYEIQEALHIIVQILTLQRSDFHKPPLYKADARKWYMDTKRAVLPVKMPEFTHCTKVSLPKLPLTWDWAFTVKIQLHRFNCISENHFICLLQQELASAVVLMKLILSTLSKQ